MSYERLAEKAVDWLSWRYDGKVSDLGQDVAVLLDVMWGLHNINRVSLRKIDWSNDLWIELTMDKPLCTVDSNDLTRLVVLCHQMMLRLEIQGIAPRYVKLIFHKRKNRDKEDGFYSWCPDIHDHVDMIIAGHPSLSEEEKG